jgi:methyl-accepting chemotaxis protein
MSNHPNREIERPYHQGEIAVSDPELRDRLRFMGLTEDDLGVIATWEEACKGVTDRLVDEFYDHILANPSTRAILKKHTTVERQRPLVTRYVLTMFSGRIDDQYIEYRRRVGVAHDDIDLDANWYVAMYEVIRRVLTEAVREAGATQDELDRFRESFSRLIQVDIALCITALMDSRRMKIEELKNLEQQKAAEAAAFIDEIGQVLDRVAARDLTARVTGDFKGDYRRIKDALNATVANLDEALGQVAAAAQQVSWASNQISSGSQALAQGASEQASSLEEVSSSLQEMESMTRQNAANSKEARNLSDSARSSAEKGSKSMARLSNAMDKIKASADETAKIVKTIDEIAFQTNLLALNAAVEAARAGDAGKGFAVVAEEVRNLAMRSAEAAKSTANLIEESVKNAENGVVINEEVLKNLEEINQQVNRVSEVMSEIAAASDQQSQGIEQINTAVEQMNQVTQQNAANAEQSAAAAEELSGQAAEMQGMVSSFRLTSATDNTVHTQQVSRMQQTPRVRVVPSSEVKVTSF